MVWDGQFLLYQEGLPGQSERAAPWQTHTGDHLSIRYQRDRVGKHIELLLTNTFKSKKPIWALLVTRCDMKH